MKPCYVLHLFYSPVGVEEGVDWGLNSEMAYATLEVTDAMAVSR